MISKKLRDHDRMLAVDQQRRLLRRTRVNDDVNLRAARRELRTILDLLETFHNQVLSRQDLPDFYETLSVGFLNPLNPV